MATDRLVEPPPERGEPQERLWRQQQGAIWAAGTYYLGTDLATVRGIIRVYCDAMNGIYTGDEMEAPDA